MDAKKKSIKRNENVHRKQFQYKVIVPHLLRRLAIYFVMADQINALDLQIAAVLVDICATSRVLYPEKEMEGWKYDASQTILVAVSHLRLLKERKC